MGAMRVCMLFFCFLLAVVSAVRQFNNINDLKNVGFSRPPRHGLQLLHWFSQRVRNIDQNGILTLDLNLNPTRGDFGFHHFGNREHILPSLNRGRMYYSVGNLNYRGANALPAYVRENRNRQTQEANMDRLMISVDPNQPNRVYNVYITSHNPGRNDFNPDDTYEINYRLTEQLRSNRVCHVNQNDIRNYIYTINEEKEDEQWRKFQEEYKRRHKRSGDLSCDTLGKFKLEIKSISNGYTKITWNMPAEVMTKYNVEVEICKNDHSVFNSEDECRSQQKQSLSELQLSGTLDTSVPLNGNLQPRLRLEKKQWFSFSAKTIICYGPELDDANGVIPTRIIGCDASLQLYAEDGWACARLYIKNTFSTWKSDFKNAWVGFYSSSQKPSDNYYTYQYTTNFEKVKDNIEDYDIYKYKSNLAIAPGVQIRFLLDKNYNNELARTTPWEDNEEVMISPSDCDNIKPKDLSHWLSPEFFYRPEFDDANRVIPTLINGFDASLQLYTKDGKACARLYIKKTFKNWKEAFYYSWVGFYSSSQEPNKSYNTYEYAIKFDKVEDIQDYEIYKYKSSLTIAPGVQVRFLQDKEYNSKLAQTPQWISVKKMSLIKL